MKLWEKGLLLWLAGGLLNAVLIRYEVGGLLRELSRLSVLVGLCLFIWGLAIRNRKK